MLLDSAALEAPKWGDISEGWPACGEPESRGWVRAMGSCRTSRGESDREAGTRGSVPSGSLPSGAFWCFLNHMLEELAQRLVGRKGVVASRGRSRGGAVENREGSPGRRVRGTRGRPPWELLGVIGVCRVAQCP